MRKILVLATVVLFVEVIISLTGCGSKYCKVSGCPSESAMNAKYCYEHKCANQSCKNVGIASFSYCEECIERAQ